MKRRSFARRLALREGVSGALGASGTGIEDVQPMEQYWRIFFLKNMISILYSN
jgi:hypothetical protein